MTVTLAAMRGGPGKEAGGGSAGGARTVRRAALAAGLLAALAAPASASAVSQRAAAKLDAASAPASELKPVTAIRLPGGATVYRFQQRVSGVKVLNGQAVVSDPRGAPPDLVADSSKPSIEGPFAPRVGRAPAIEAALRSTGVKRLRGHWSAGLAIEPGDGGTLVWRIVIPAARPLGDFEVLVDAADGHVVRARDLLQHSRRGHAQLYNPNPVVEHNGSSGLHSDKRDQNTRLLTSLRRRVTLHDIRGGQRCLRGKWVHAKLGREAREVCKRGLDWWGVKRSMSRFEALMTYFHIDRAQRYIRSLGFGTGTAEGVNDRSQVAVADAFRDDNSWYSTATRRIKYGSGGVDDAEDGDVILHEYGHAIQDAQVRWFGNSHQSAAIGEGFGDYWAAAMSSRSPGTSQRDDVCIFDWDGIRWGGFVPAFGRRCGRRVDNDQTWSEAAASCPDDPFFVGKPEIHCLGEVWSSALWDLRHAVGATAFDRIVLSSQFMYTPSEHFNAAVGALIAADEASASGGANKPQICAEMETQRGISVGDCP